MCELCMFTSYLAVKIPPMFRLLTSSFLLFLSGAFSLSFAQSEIEVFSEVGDAFTLYLNQVQMNEVPSPRVLATVDVGFYQVRIDFEEDGRPDLFKNSFGTEAGMRSTGKITMNRKGQFVLRAFGFAPMSSSPSPESASAIPSSTTPSSASSAANTAMSTNVTVTGTAAEAGQGSNTTEQINMNVNVGGNFLPGGLNMNVQMSSTESWTTTESTSHSSSASSWGEGNQASEEDVDTSSHVGMNALDFQDYLRAIQSKDFEDSKMSTAQAPLNAGAMLSAAQIAEVMKAFDYESTRLEFAVFAHSKCVDVHNYYKTHGSFEYELSIDDLNDAIGQ